MEPDPLDAAARGLLNHLAGAVQRGLRLTNDLAVDLGGGLGAAVLAALASEHSDVPVVLVFVRGAAQAPGPARALARRFGVALAERVVLPREAAAARRHVAAVVGVPARRADDPLVRHWFACREAAVVGRRLLSAAGAEEVLGGRTAGPADASRPVRPRKGAAGPIEGRRPGEERIADAFGLQLRYPYLDRGVVPWARSLPPSARLATTGHGAPVLRHAALAVGLSEDEIAALEQTTNRFTPIQ